MPIYSFRNRLSLILTVVFVLSGAPYSLAASRTLESSQDDLEESSYSSDRGLLEMKRQGRFYRKEGLNAQQRGDMEGALSYYKKAIALDPTYAATYNDLGIVYDLEGSTELAKENYLKCANLDPHYVSAYTNLALLYESKRDLSKAAFYWDKRVRLGLEDDPWTQKAKKRLEDLRTVMSANPLEYANEQATIKRLKDDESARRKDNAGFALSLFEEAKAKFKKGDLVGSLKLAIDAKQLDPDNDKIDEFISKVQRRALSR